MFLAFVTMSAAGCVPHWYQGAGTVERGIWTTACAPCSRHMAREVATLGQTALRWVEDPLVPFFNTKRKQQCEYL